MKVRDDEGGSTPLDDGSYVLQFWIEGSKVIGPNPGTENAMVWNYPLGGTPSKTIGGLDDPVGPVVSGAQ